MCKIVLLISDMLLKSSKKKSLVERKYLKRIRTGTITDDTFSNDFQKKAFPSSNTQMTENYSKFTKLHVNGEVAFLKYFTPPAEIHKRLSVC